jgi:hypothetical protein
MKAILNKYKVTEKLLLLSFLTLVSKPIVGQFLQSSKNTNYCYSEFDLKKVNSSSFLKVAPFGDFEKTEFIEESEELVEDEDNLDFRHSIRNYFFLPTTSTLDKIVINSYKTAFLKTFNKPKYYITYSCLRSYLN